MSLAVSLVRSTVSLEGTLTHDTLTDDESWLALNSLSLLDSSTNLSSVVTVDLDNLPVLSAILSSSILVHNLLSLCRELDVIAVIEHDEVVKTEVTSDTSSTLRNLLLNTTVRDICVDSLLCECWVACVLSKELSSDSSTNSVSVTLTERT